MDRSQINIVKICNDRGIVKPNLWSYQVVGKIAKYRPFQHEHISATTQSVLRIGITECNTSGSHWFFNLLNQFLKGFWGQLSAEVTIKRRRSATLEQPRHNITVYVLLPSGLSAKKCQSQNTLEAQASRAYQLSSRTDDWLRFYGILSTQIEAISAWNSLKFISKANVRLG